MDEIIYAVVTNCKESSIPFERKRQVSEWEFSKGPKPHENNQYVYSKYEQREL